MTYAMFYAALDLFVLQFAEVLLDHTKEELGPAYEVCTT
jgi:hypothetical protein